MAELVNKSDQSEIQTAKAPRNRSNFDLSHHHLTTLRFGEVAPFFNLEAVNNDKITLRSQHDLSTFTLKSPILSNIRLRKDYFSVPMESILPFNWEKIITNPLFGDDVDADNCNCVIDLSKLSTLLNSIKARITEKKFETKPLGFFNSLSILELIFSKGSLLSRLGYNFSNCLKIVNTSTSVTYNIDDFVDYYYSQMFGINDFIDINYFNDELQVVTKRFDIRTRADLRTFHDFVLSHVLDSEMVADIFDAGSIPYTNFDFQFILNDAQAETQYYTKYNIAPVAAYQLCVAHFMSNDKVDYIYNAELYRQLMHSLSDDYDQTFVYNGVRTPYDYLSGYFINNCLAYIDGVTDDNKCIKGMLYLQNLLGFRRSLRYVDYFTSAKTHPLALGDTSVQVSTTDKVDVVDITRNIQMQRFLNFANRAGRKFEEYISKLNGKFVAPDYHNPQYLGGTIDRLYNSKVENTSSEQMTKSNSVTSTFGANSENFAFSFECDRPSIILGLVSFDIVRAYANSVRRDSQHIDRFDYFNPFLQHIGDQQIFGFEYLANPQGLFRAGNYGYTTRHAEYKEEVSRADSGFIDGSLPSWAFVNKPIEWLSEDSVFISPESIRSYPEELDDYYLDLPYVGNSKYFHFIVDFFNSCEAIRPMIKKPEIL